MRKVKNMSNFRFFLLAGFLLGICNLSNAAEPLFTSHTQASGDRFFTRFTPQAGVIYSNYQSDNQVNYANREGWTAGALADLGTSIGSFALETGLMFREVNGAATVAGGNASYTYDYLSLPISGKYYLSGNDVTSLYVKLGALISTLTGSRVQYSPGYSGSPRDFGGRTWEVGALAAVGARFILSPNTDIFVEGLYSRPVDILFSSVSGFNSSWSVGAGVGLTL